MLGRPALNHQRYTEEERQELHEKSGKGKKGRASTVAGATSGKAAEAAAVPAPGLFDEEA